MRILILSALLIGCQGTADVDSSIGTPFDVSVEDSGSDVSPTPTPDAGTDALYVADVPPDDPCFEVPCGANASCSEGVCACETGFIGDANTGCAPADPCASVTCSYGATCSAGACVCDAGFDPGPNDTCVAQSPGDTAARTQADVCNRWNTDRVSQSQQVFQVDPSSPCDLGTLHPDTITDALRRTTLFRWLVGLPAVTSNPGQQENVQSCATTLAASNRGLSHSLDATYTCFTPAAGSGAGSSNLAQGVSRPADSVNLYVGDNGVRSLGHRRWVLNPRMGSTAFGQRDSYGCMYAFDSSGSANPQYVAYPAPGFFPRAALIGYWSFSSSQLPLSATTTVSMTRTDTGAEVPVNDVYFPGGGYGIPAIAWQVPNAATDIEYEVTVANLSGATPSVTYRTTLVACN